MDELREQLAALAHEQWSEWWVYAFSKAAVNDDGSVTFPAWAVTRWTRQMMTSYAALSDAEKESDRAEADRMLKIVQQSGQFAIIGKSGVRPTFSIEDDDG